MAKIYRLTDKIEYKIGEIKVTISPMSVADKAISSSFSLKGQLEKDPSQSMEAIIWALKVAVKNVEGIVYEDGTKFVCRFDDNKHLTRECVEEILNLEESTILSVLVGQFLSGVPAKDMLPKGVKLIESNEEKNEQTQK